MARRRPARTVPLAVAAGLALSACSDGITDSDTGARATSSTTVTVASDGPADEVSLPPPLDLTVPDPGSIYDPVRGGEPLPAGFRQVLGRDDIAPVYDPRFTTAAGVSWPEDSLVIGVDLNDEARAYPVGFLNRREIVNDDHRGIPTLVTW